VSKAQKWSFNGRYTAETAQEAKALAEDSLSRVGFKDVLRTNISVWEDTDGQFEASVDAEGY